MGGNVSAGPSFLQSLIGKMCPNFSFAFFYEMVGQVWTQGETEERLRKKQSVLYLQVLEMGGTGVVRGRGECLGHSLYWRFHGKGKAGKAAWD